MPTHRQARESQRRRISKLEAKHEARRQRRERRIRITALVTAIAMALGVGGTVIFSLLGGFDTTTDDSTVAPSTTPAVPSPSPTDDAGADLDTDDDAGDEGDQDRLTSESLTPPDPARAESRLWQAVISTSVGDIEVELDGEAAPQAVASFVALAQEGFFDQTDCHRLTTSGIFVLQCGDPTGTGTGGPGYRFGPIENAPDDGVYPAGTLAMARVGNDGSSMGSQFFIVYEDSTIPSDQAGGYTIFGTVTAGLGIVGDVARAGTVTGESDGRPAQSVIVNEVSVS